jgi:hypothetical protein
VTVEVRGFAVYAGEQIVRRNVDHRNNSSDSRPTVRGRMRIDGRRFVHPDGSPFIWRFATGFRLLDLLADGDAAGVDRFMAWARDTGFNGVRVLTMAAGLFDLRPEAGRCRLDALLERAASHDLYVELVALADTRALSLTGDELREQVRAVGGACARHLNCAGVEIANEPWHPSQADALHDPAFLTELAHLVPAPGLVTEGAAPDDEQIERWLGGYVVRHLDRSRDKWNRTRRVRELENLSRETVRPVVNDEPIGASEADQPGRRSADPAEFFALGVLNRVFGVGGTFHFEDGLQARVPGPVQQACAEAFLHGSTLWPDEVETAFFNAGWAASPVRSADFDRAIVRAYSAVTGAGGWLVLVGLTADPRLELGAGWQLGALVAERPQVQVFTLRHSAAANLDR